MATDEPCIAIRGMSAFGGIADIAICPLYPQKRTLELSLVMSALCQ